MRTTNGPALGEAARSTASRPARIAIITGFTLAMNPRVLKEATTLRAAGHEVIVIGASLDRTRLVVDQELATRHGFEFRSVVSLSHSGQPDRWRSLAQRIRGRLAGKLYEFSGIQSRFQLGNFVSELLYATKACRADYHIVHLEQALWVGSQLLQTGMPVGIDMEDWYSEDLLPEARRHRPLGLLRDLERQLLQHAAHRSCTSHAMSDALSREFGCSSPAVVYNTFPWSDRARLDGRRVDRRNSTRPSLHWFSQTIGPGRGLEELFQALEYVTPDLEIHLRGQLNATQAAWLRKLVPEPHRDRVFAHPLVPNEELLSRIAEHDIGFAGEMRYCRSRDLTVTNKLFQYLIGGLAVVASDTAGQREIAAAAPEAISLYPSGNVQALAAQINGLLISPETLGRTRAAALRAAEDKFCWERSSTHFLGLVESAVGSGKP
jgi:glycosyltransferase involved in cell wall biosynthesis